MSTIGLVRRVRKLPQFFQGMLLGSILLLVIFSLNIFIHGITESRAIAQGLAASFTWTAGNAVTTAHITNESYTGPRPAQVVYALYWCKKGGTAPCAPDFSGDGKSEETLTFQTISLPVPDTGYSQDVVMPSVTALASKNCGRFQVDLGLDNNGGIVGGTVFAIGGDCQPPPAVSPTPVASIQPSATPVASPPPGCPYVSTQAQVQKNDQDPWGDAKTISLGESVRLGGFHNGTGRFAGDLANTYSPNTVNVDFFMTEPGGASNNLLTASAYPVLFTPTKIGNYIFTGKTRKEAGNLGAGYFSETNCTDSGTITVTGPAPSATPSPAPSASPGASVSPSPSPSEAPKITQLKLCKYQDDNADGVKNSGENVISWKFTVKVSGESDRTVESHWWNALTQGCAVTDVPAGKEITVEEESKSGWRLTAVYADGNKTNNSNYVYTSNQDQVKVLWFLNTFTPTGGPAGSPTPTPSPVAGNAEPQCISLSANPTFGAAELSVNFVGKGRDSDGIIKQIEFNFGDGSSQTIDTNGATNAETSASVTHRYKTASSFFASVRVKDNSGLSNESSSVPDSCRVKIEVAGQVLGGQTTPAALPKAGAETLLSISYVISAAGGILLKTLAKKLRNI